MKQIINGKTYNTETATEIGGIGSVGTHQGDFQDWSATLYRTRNGRYFMAGRGGPSSPFSVSAGQNAWSGSSGIIALTPDEALAYAERDLDADTITEHFGDQIEEA